MLLNFFECNDDQIRAIYNGADIYLSRFVHEGRKGILVPRKSASEVRRYLKREKFEYPSPFHSWLLLEGEKPSEVPVETARMNTAETTWRVEFATWQGEGQGAWEGIIREYLLPYLGMNVKVWVPHKRVTEPIQDEYFHIFIWSSPSRTQQATIVPPETLWNEMVDCRDPGFTASEHGETILDNEGHFVGELIGNCLYVFHDLCHTGSSSELRILKNVLLEVVLMRKPEYLGEPNQEVAEEEINFGLPKSPQTPAELFAVSMLQPSLDKMKELTHACQSEALRCECLQRRKFRLEDKIAQLTREAATQKKEPDPRIDYANVRRRDLANDSRLNGLEFVEQGILLDVAPYRIRDAESQTEHQIGGYHLYLGATSESPFVAKASPNDNTIPVVVSGDGFFAPTLNGDGRIHGHNITIETLDVIGKSGDLLSAAAFLLNYCTQPVLQPRWFRTILSKFPVVSS